MKTAIFTIEGIALRRERLDHQDTGRITAGGTDGGGLVRQPPGIFYEPRAVGEDDLVAVIQKPGFRIVGRQ